jgi:hypothetical protein
MGQDPIRKSKMGIIFWSVSFWFWPDETLAPRRAPVAATHICCPLCGGQERPPLWRPRRPWCTREAVAKRPLLTATTGTATQRLPFTAEAVAFRPLLGMLERQPKGRRSPQKQGPLLKVLERRPKGRHLLQKQRPFGCCLWYWNGDPKGRRFFCKSTQTANQGGSQFGFQTGVKQ